MKVIPIEAVPSRTYRATLDGYKVQFRIKWQTLSTSWFIDLDCEAVGLASHGFSLVTGRDMIANRTKGDMGALVLVDAQGDEDPTFDGLGVRWLLVYVTRDELGMTS